jgi:acetylornithine deacetylase/succinyl-diaminopimelate desuccinylase-like protein
VESEFRSILGDLAAETGAEISAELFLMRDAFVLDQKHPLVSAFQAAHTSLCGAPLPFGAKPFCDDGNSFWALAGIPAITHGPRGAGAHTLQEWVSVADLVRVAKVYAATAVLFCAGIGQ